MSCRNAIFDAFVIDDVTTLCPAKLESNRTMGVAKIFAAIDAYVKKRCCSLGDLFSAVDQGGDGTCDLTELRLGLDRIGIRVSNTDFSTLSTMFDPDGSGEIDFSEFVDAIKLGHAVNIKKVDVVDGVDGVNSVGVVSAVGVAGDESSTKDTELNVTAKKDTVLIEKKEAASVVDELKRAQKQSSFFHDYTDGETDDNNSAASVIRQLKIALEHSEEKWKKKFAQFKEVVHKHHTTKLQEKIQEVVQLHEVEKSGWGGLQNNLEKKGDRENVALRAKCGRLTKELNRYKKMEEERQMEKTVARQSEEKKLKAKRHWATVRTDMEKTSEAKDKFAEIMRQGTMKALRSVREEAMQALAETQQKLKKAAATVQEKDTALDSADALQIQMNEQISVLQTLVSRTEEEKKKYEEQNAKATNDRVRQRFAAAKVAASHRRTLQEKKEAEDHTERLQSEVQLLRDEANVHADAQIRVNTLTEQLESKINLIQSLRGWMLFQRVTMAVYVRTLKEKVQATNVVTEHQQCKLGEREAEIDVLLKTLADVQQRLHISELTAREIKSELDIVRSEKRSAQKMIASLASHTNTLQHALSSFGSSKQKRKKQPTHNITQILPKKEPTHDSILLVDCNNGGVIKGWSLANQSKDVVICKSHTQNCRGYVSSSGIQKRIPYQKKK